MIVDNIRIYWKYTHCPIQYFGDKKKLINKEVIRTECFIVSKNSLPEAKPLAYSFVQPHHSDVYDKEKGRKLTLERALVKLGVDREFRTKVWEAYRTMSPIPKW